MLQPIRSFGELIVGIAVATVLLGLRQAGYVLDSYRSVKVEFTFGNAVRPGTQGEGLVDPRSTDLLGYASRRQRLSHDERRDRMWLLVHCVKFTKAFRTSNQADCHNEMKGTAMRRAGCSHVIQIGLAR